MDEVQRISQQYKAFTDPSAFLANLERREISVSSPTTPVQSVEDILSSHPPRRKKFAPPFDK